MIRLQTRPHAICGLLLLFLFILAVPVEARPIQSFLKEGDLIFQETRSQQARALKLATNSRYTHVGIAFQYRGRWQVLEAVQPVRITPIQSFLNRGVRRHYVIKRLNDRENILTPEKIKELKEYGKRYTGKNYDIYFSWDDSRIYCTELAWKMYKNVLGVELGQLQTLGDFDLSHPFVQKILRQRYGNKPPLKEPVIAVSTMFAAPVLYTVHQAN